MLLMGHTVFLDQDANGQARIRPGFATPTDETRTIGHWTARKVVIKAMDITSESWYTKDSPGIGGRRTHAHALSSPRPTKSCSSRN